MSKKVYLLVVASTVTYLLFYFFYIITPFGNTLPGKKILIIAHKGYTSQFNENTLNSVMSAQENKFDGVDIDLRKTSDNEIVMYHDKTIDLNGGSTLLASKSYRELKDLPIHGDGTKINPDDYISRFEDIITLASTTIIAELKTGGMEKLVIDIIKNHNKYENVYISSFDPVSILLIKKYDPQIKTVLILTNKEYTSENIPQNNWVIKKIRTILSNEIYNRLVINLTKPDLLSIRYDVSSEFISTLIEKGYLVLLWSPNKEKTIASSIRLQPYAIISDNPDLVRRLMSVK